MIQALGETAAKEKADGSSPQHNLLKSESNWPRRMRLSTISSKVLMAVTGLALLGFVSFHMLGNLQIYLGQDQLNAYAAFLKGMPALLWTARLGLLSVFVAHIGLAVYLKIVNRAARPVRYVYDDTVQASLASRTMLLSGLVILAFVIYHLLHFTLGITNPADHDLLDAKGRHDVYSMVVLGFQNPFISGVDSDRRTARFRDFADGSCSMTFDAKTPSGPLSETWDRHRTELKLVSPANKRKYRVIVVGTGLAGASAAASLAELGYHVDALPVSQPAAESAMDAAACISCGACVAACKNASAMLFTAAKVSHLASLPQGHPERAERTKRMIAAMDAEHFGSCTNQSECEAVCPKQISVDWIAKLNREHLAATVGSRQAG